MYVWQSSLNLSLNLNLNSLPIYPELGDDKIKEIIQAIKEFSHVIGE